MTDQLGQYRLIERIAAGGMGEVFKAKLVREAGFEKTVAVKRMLPHLSQSADFEQRFCGEARLSAQLSHTNIVHVYDFGLQGDSLFLAMEYVDGVDLGSLLARLSERGERLAPALALEICAQALKGLDFAHRMRADDGRPLKLIHRDISPSNILISFEGEVKLTDFGLAHAHQDVGDDLLVGKEPYLPPEQVRGEVLDRRSDLYMLGLVLYDMLYGKKAFPDALPSPARLKAIAAGAVDFPERDGVDGPLVTLLQRACHREKSERFASAAEMLKAVEAERDRLKASDDENLSALVSRVFADRRQTHSVAPEKTILSPRPIAQTPAPKPVAPESKPKRLGAVLALLLVVVAIAAGAYVFWPQTRSMKITSEPPGAEIWLDGKPTGQRTPATLKGFEPGSGHAVAMALADYERYSDTVIVPQNKNLKIAAQLARQVRAVTLASTPEGASVWLNGEALDGKTPLELAQLPVGIKHTLRVSLDGFVPHQSEFFLEPGEGPQPLAVTLESLYRDLVVNVAPAEAELYVDGERVAGDSPYRLTGLLPNRQVRLSATLKGYRSEQRRVVPKDVDGPLAITLSPFNASLRLEGQGLRASVDGVARSLPLRVEQAQRKTTLISLRPAETGPRLIVRAQVEQARDQLGRWVTEAVLNVDAQPWATVSVDQRAPITTPKSGLRLRSGRHRLRFTLGSSQSEYDVILHVQ